MSSSKVRRAIYGPSWSEVILGAILSAVLGVVLGAVLLVVRPVVTAKEEPKERVKGAVYYIEGTRDSNKGSAAAQKRVAFAGGQSVSIVEDELNTLIGAAPGAAAAKAPEKARTDPKAKGKDAPAGADDGLVSVGKPNVRIRAGAMQVAVPVTVNALDLGLKFTAQARGGFVKKGDSFVYEPSELYLGSCPVQHLPLVGSLVRGKFLSAEAIPDDIKAAWAKATQVAIDGATLRITMP